MSDCGQCAGGRRGKKTKRKQGPKKVKRTKGKKKTSRRGSLGPKMSSSYKKSSIPKPKKGKKGKKTKKTKKKGKMNAYMLALQKARKANAPSFTYNGKTYYQKTTKTGMIIYGAKK
jgi:hypothetical protein